MSSPNFDFIDEARRVIRIETDSMALLSQRLNQNFIQAVDLILNCKGKVIVSGIGKSGHIGRKIASTLSSTGTPAVFLHPAEGSHGDLGVVASGDVVITISYGGESEELLALVKYAVRRNVPLVAITGNLQSALAKSASVCLEIPITEEACPLGLAPTSSSTVTLVLGDCLAMATLKARGFKREDFAEFHPGGSLGRRLTTRVRDLMHGPETLPLVSEDDPLSKVLTVMTAREVRGVAGVISSSGELTGVITDGDIRRRMERNQGPLIELARDIMSRNPKTIDQDELAEKALFLMQEFKIQMLFALDRQAEHPQRPVGLLHLQDLLQAQFR